ncbi:hypothetical protein VSR01_17540 [Actinacidiphila sp. DG2A-62]|uniref:hypothetical protein n=1 Tax=Actinacidiphila sp. DG2A-62 TaxID=3108821 RepID=UPI002DBBB87B|nr:hypothetical protein [Actinacidiphila sp. DG2A-62]MEC3995243.1 hypothetical protein [Actinacidiphila sp. DG2A-62]
MDESFGPEYVRPAQPDCPRCGCCTAALCEKGRHSIMRCNGHVDDEHREMVGGCPCSAETTRHTAAWRAAQVRVTRMAHEMPVDQAAEDLLRALAKGPAEADDEVFRQLKFRGLAQLVHGIPAITPLGHTYLASKDDVRAPAAVQVLDVDKKTRTARVEVAPWRPDEPVTVLLDQLVTDTGLDVDALPGLWLAADANCHADHADKLVLTGFRQAAPLPQGWMDTSGGDVE